MVQWVRLPTPNGQGPGLSPGQGTKIPYTTTKPCTAAKTQRSQNK